MSAWQPLLVLLHSNRTAPVRSCQQTGFVGQTNPVFCGGVITLPRQQLRFIPNELYISVKNFFLGSMPDPSVLMLLQV